MKTVLECSAFMERKWFQWWLLDRLFEAWKQEPNRVTKIRALLLRRNTGARGLQNRWQKKVLGFTKFLIRVKSTGLLRQIRVLLSILAEWVLGNRAVELLRRLLTLNLLAGDWSHELGLFLSRSQMFTKFGFEQLKFCLGWSSAGARWLGAILQLQNLVVLLLNDLE